MERTLPVTPLCQQNTGYSQLELWLVGVCWECGACLGISGVPGVALGTSV